jgi:hypothetical protein
LTLPSRQVNRALANLNLAFELADQANAKKWAAHRESLEAEDKIDVALTKRELKRVDYLRRGGDDCREKVGRALSHYPDWTRLWDERKRRYIDFKPYALLPLYWRVIAHYLDFGTLTRPGVPYTLMFHFGWRRDGVIRTRFEH